MRKLYLWKTGVALAIAVCIGYSVLSLLFAFWPESGAAFQEALTTGAGFGNDGVRTHWSFGAFAYALGLLALWGLTTGALFAWVHAQLHRSDSRN